MKRKTIGDALRHARQHYQSLDAAIARDVLAKRRDVKCKKGCAGCCYQLVGLSFVEALIIADYLVRNRPDDVPTLLARLDEDTARLPGSNPERFMSDRKPCAFLKLTGDYVTGECTIYRSRPLACRLEYVVTDPRNCYPDGVHEVGRLDTRKAHVEVLQAMIGGSGMLAGYGPLPPLVAEAIRCIMNGKRPSETFISHWSERMAMMLDHDRGVLVQLGIKERYL